MDQCEKPVEVLKKLPECKIIFSHKIPGPEQEGRYRSIGDAVRYQKPCMMRHRRECRVYTEDKTSELQSSEPYDSKLRIYTIISVASPRLRLFARRRFPHIRAKAHHAGQWISYRASYLRHSVLSK